MSVPYFDSEREYIDFLEDTLIPDLNDSGKRRMAQDFKEAIYWLSQKKSMKKRSQKSSKKVTRSPKAKILDKMTKPIWNKYKKGRGKKTYVQIRAQVSRSQKYKRAVKRL